MTHFAKVLKTVAACAVLLPLLLFLILMHQVDKIRMGMLPW